MKKPVFTLRTVNPNTLKAHASLSSMGHAYETNAVFNAVKAYFNHYNQPVVDLDNNVLSHYVDVQAAVANGKSKIEVLQVALSEMDVLKFILTEHKYHLRNAIASYETADYWRNYLDKDPDGIKLAKTMKGKTADKIAELMHTSDSSIKRLLRVGDNAPEKLGLIANGETSLKEVIDELNAEKHKGTLVANDADPADNVEEKEQNTAQEEVKQVATSYTPPTQTPALQFDKPTTTSKPKGNFDEPTSTDGLMEFTTGIRFGNTAISVDVVEGKPKLFVNGKELRNVSYDVVVNREDEQSGSTTSFIFEEAKSGGVAIQITIENL